MYTENKIVQIQKEHEQTTNEIFLIVLLEKVQVFRCVRKPNRLVVVRTNPTDVFCLRELNLQSLLHL